MSNIYYGFKTLPKGKIRATAEQAFNKKQIKYWGVESVPKDLLNNELNKKIVRKPRKKVVKKDDIIKKIEKKYKLKLNKNGYDTYHDSYKDKIIFLKKSLNSPLINTAKRNEINLLITKLDKLINDLHFAHI